MHTVFQPVFVLKGSTFGRDAPCIMEHAASSMEPIFRRRVSPHRALPELHSCTPQRRGNAARSACIITSATIGWARRRSGHAYQCSKTAPDCAAAHAARKCFKATARQHTRWSRTRLESTLIPSRSSIRQPPSRANRCGLHHVWVAHVR